MDLLGVFYMSRATRSLSPAELDKLLIDARTHNAAVGITGVLLYGDNRFFQYFEGSPSAVAAVYERIHRAASHTDLVELERRPIAERLFHKWFMGFRELPMSQLQKLSQDQWNRERPWAEDHAEVSPRIQQLLAFF